MASLHHLPQTGPGGRIAHRGPFQEGDQVTLECEMGYKLPTHSDPIVSKVIAVAAAPAAAAGSSTSSSVVLAWEPDPLPGCAPVHSGAPFIPDHCTLTNTTLFTFPASFRYVCDPGYVLNHHLDTFFCSASGHWTPAIPTTLRCDPIRCQTLVVPLHGSLVQLIGDGSYGSEATFACDPFYEMVRGSPKRMCLANGEWSGDDVECRELACPPLDPRARVLLPEGSQIQIVDCGNGKSVTVKCLWKGQWSKPWPYCNAPPPPSLPPSPSPPPSPPPPPRVKPGTTMVLPAVPAGIVPPPPPPPPPCSIHSPVPNPPVVVPPPPPGSNPPGVVVPSNKVIPSPPPVTKPVSKPNLGMVLWIVLGLCCVLLGWMVKRFLKM